MNKSRKQIKIWHLELLTPEGIQDLKVGHCSERNIFWVRRDLYHLFQGWQNGRYVNTTPKIRGTLKEV